MNIAILGYGLQGKSAYEFYNSPENNITICDQDTPLGLPEGVRSQTGDHYLNNLDQFDLIVRSPGIHPKDITQFNDPSVLERVTTNSNEFFKNCPTKNIIGVTGTKGKGTTSTLITKMLQAGGHKVFLGGNIGVPPLDLLRQDIDPEDYVVLELANFQLVDLQYSPHIAVCLLVEPEHLDWHSDVDEYYEAKTQIFRHQSSDDIAIYYAANENSERIASTGPAKKIPYFATPGAVVAGNHITIDGHPIIRLSELKLIGKHNYQNVCAAVTTVWQIMPDLTPIAETLREFSGLAFRLEFIRKVNEVSYFDDSFGSAPTATIAAIDAINGYKVMIIGGKDRGLDLSELADSLKNHEENIRRVILIGEARDRIAQALTKADFSNYQLSESKDIKEIVELAASLASPGDRVILSPGFPSFDMFKNFEDRGVQFNEAVNSL